VNRRTFGQTISAGLGALVLPWEAKAEPRLQRYGLTISGAGLRGVKVRDFHIINGKIHKVGSIMLPPGLWGIAFEDGQSAVEVKRFGSWAEAEDWLPDRSSYLRGTSGFCTPNKWIGPEGLQYSKGRFVLCSTYDWSS